MRLTPDQLVDGKYARHAGTGEAWVGVVKAIADDGMAWPSSKREALAIAKDLGYQIMGEQPNSYPIKVQGGPS